MFKTVNYFKISFCAKNTYFEKKRKPGKKSQKPFRNPQVQLSPQ